MLCSALKGAVMQLNPQQRKAYTEYNEMLAHIDARRHRADQCRRGRRNEETGEWEGGLYAFVKYFWHILEPETPMVPGWPMEAICQHLEAVTYGEITRLLINVPPGFCKSLLVDVFWPAWEWACAGKAHLRYVTFSYSASLTERDNRRFGDLVTCKDFRDLYGEKVKIVKKGDTLVTNTRKGWKLASSVGGVGTGERGDRVILDDPHNVKEAESDIVRSETVRWFRESMSDRLNDMKRGAIIIIMQRVHEDDVSGTILSVGMDYCHLCVPMEFDTSRVYDEKGNLIKTQIGWVDPRLDEDDLDGCDLTTAWDERFDDETIARLKKEGGPYKWCNPGEAPVLMGDLSLKRIDEVKVGDTVVGFETGDRNKRARLKPSKVLSISKSVQPVVKMLLDSEHTIRCTPDHKWFTGRYGKGRKTYAPASVGSVLRRVCPHGLPQLETEEEFRLAGWVSGFFDGEGTVSVQRYGGKKDHASLISFHQTAEQNLPLCERLEYSLSRLGFDFNCREHQPTTLSSAGTPWQKKRNYYLRSDAGSGKRGSRLQLNQRFLHLIKPTKWRQRLIDTTVNGRMSTTAEKVLAIKPDGRDIVYGLETTTGNYVVWGLASSNSGQYQQSPSPRGGGLFKTSWWQVWEGVDGKFPIFDVLIASVDSAFTKDQMNDPTGMTVWGVWHLEGKRRLMLVHAWRKHLEFSGVRTPYLPGETKVQHTRRTQETWGLMEWVAHTCERFKVDKLLIEAKASGISAAQELRNRYGMQDWSTQLCPVKGDKVARAIGVQAVFANLGIYAPIRDWSDEVIQEMAVFPNGKYDDLTDSATMAVKWLRDNGLAPTDEEVLHEEQQAIMHKSKMKQLYPV